MARTDVAVALTDVAAAAQVAVAVAALDAAARTEWLAADNVAVVPAAKWQQNEHYCWLQDSDQICC